ncbi:hypothetical protein [Paenibacillus tianjinensis]|uniref:Uncharacterized protein n=1 Tax=Paenibacillus tianjinensis TaxID=2810347 RepID=A0ABX7LAC3_9BACL|nr:hypothetical protein [Paenibacillus tianjinensis]QSF43390.1 hypothetical protein JRJ22_19175 [Paenibacillus tianjinensis]
MKDETVYSGPDVGSGKDVQWIKVLNGKVDARKPSFASNDEIIDTLREFDLEKPL